MQPPDPSREPLNYEPGVDRVKRGSGGRIGRGVGFLGSLVLGFIGAFYAGGMVAYAAQGKSGYIALVYICIVIVMAAGLVAFIRQTPVWNASKWAFLGLFIGCGVALLAEGICFSVSPNM